MLPGAVTSTSNIANLLSRRLIFVRRVTINLYLKTQIFLFLLVSSFLILTFREIDWLDFLPFLFFFFLIGLKFFLPCDIILPKSIGKTFCETFPDAGGIRLGRCGITVRFGTRRASRVILILSFYILDKSAVFFYFAWIDESSLISDDP